MPRAVSSIAAAAAAPSSAAASAPSRSMAGYSGRDVRMRVILSRDQKLGSEHDVVDVKRGYGRNVLVRKGGAVYATAENLHRSAVKQQQQKEAAIKAMGGDSSAGAQSATATDSSSSSSAAAKPSAASAAAASAAYLLLSPEARRYHQDVLRRLANQRALTFSRPSVLRDTHTLATPLTLREVHAKLARLHPYLSVRDLEFASGGSTLSKYGLHVVTINVPGQQDKQVQFNINVRRTGDVTATGAGAAAKAGATTAAAAPKAKSAAL